MIREKIAPMPVKLFRHVHYFNLESTLNKYKFINAGNGRT